MNKFDEISQMYALGSKSNKLQINQDINYTGHSSHLCVWKLIWGTWRFHSVHIFFRYLEENHYKGCGSTKIFLFDISIVIIHLHQVEMVMYAFS